MLKYFNPLILLNKKKLKEIITTFNEAAYEKKSLQTALSRFDKIFSLINLHEVSLADLIDTFESRNGDIGRQTTNSIIFCQIASKVRK